MLEGLTVCMIVKNEELHIPGCLDAVEDLAGELIVVDTGSTDATPGLAAGRGAKVVPFDFTTIDFAAARNYAIAQSTRRWILMLDADETLDPAGATMIQEIVLGNENAGYFLERHNQVADFGSAFTDYVVRLFPNRHDYRYHGRVHETVDASILSGGGRLHKTGIRIQHKFSSDPDARRRKNLRYIEILKEEIAADPSDISRFDFLAAEYHQLEMFQQATAVAEHIAQMRPLDARAQLFAGIYRLRYQPDLPLARRYFNRALKLRPGYVEAESFLRSLDEQEKNEQEKKQRVPDEIAAG